MPSLPPNDASRPLWLHTPLFFSQHLSNILDADVYLKLENVQISQSFKYRGISLIAQKAKSKSPDSHLVIASGGNAGLAAACAANAVGLKCSVYLPLGLDSKFLDTLREQNAHVFEHGVNYEEAFKKAQQVVAEDERNIQVSAYDDETLWEGHASMIDEISSDLSGTKPDAIFCSVGGGGLLAGIIVGCKRAGWDDVIIGALETIGADCFFHSMRANQDHHLRRQSQPETETEIRANGNGNGNDTNHLTTFYDPVYDVELVRLNAITSMASSLGASTPAPGVVRMALDRKGPVKCVLVPDSLCMHTADKFAADHKFLVELACSTTLVPAYNKNVFDKIVPGVNGKRRTVVFIVCGGNKVSIDDLNQYRKAVINEINEQTSEPWKVIIEGEGEVGIEVGK